MQSADIYFVRAENEYRHPTTPPRAAAPRRRHVHRWHPLARRRRA